MRWFIYRIPVLWFTSVALIVFALTAGRSQASSGPIQQLHLADCAAPCWAGIVPGQTSFYAAYQRIVEVFGPPAESSRDIAVMFSDDAPGVVSVTLPGTSINATFYITDDHLVQRVTLGYPQDAPPPRMPTVGDMVGLLGPPQCVQVHVNLWMLVYSTPTGLVVIQLDQPTAPQWTQPIRYVHFVGQYSNGKTNLIDNCASARLPLLPWSGLISAARYRWKP